MYMLPHMIDRSNVIPQPPSIIFFFFTEKANNPKIHMDPQRTLSNQNNIEKKEQSRRTHVLILKHTIKLQKSKQHGAGINTDI